MKINSLVNITKRPKRRLADTPGCADELLCEFRHMFEKLHFHQEDKFKTLATSIITLIEQNNDIQKAVDFISSQYDTLVNRIDTLEKDNQHFKSHIKTLEKKIDLLEMDSKSTSIELRNIPKLDQEDKQSLCEHLVPIFLISNFAYFFLFFSLFLTSKLNIATVLIYC